MMKFREKWFWALCLAILVHAGVFLVFHLNTSNTDWVEMTDSQTNTNEPLAINNVNLLEKVYTTTVTKHPDDTNNNLDDTFDNKSQVSKLTSSNEQTASSDNVKMAPSQASNYIDEKPTKLASTSLKATQRAKTLSKNEKISNAQIDRNIQSMVTNTNDKMENTSNNISLLDTDVPAQESSVKVDKDYLLAKSEVENINDQLSTAINEVKKRNQQKIDERQQLRNKTSITDNQ